MTTNTVKHRETAEQITNDFRMIEDGCEGDLMEMIARALAKAEREGMKRAAEIAQARYTAASVRKKKDGEPYVSGLLAISVAETIAAAILSEAGEVLSYSQSGLSYSDARSE